MYDRAWIGIARRVAAIAVATLATGGCLVTSTAPPLQPGVESVPGANVAIREKLVIDQLGTIKRAEDIYFATHNKYADMRELVSSGGLNVSPQGLGYTIDLTATDSGYKAIAVPVEYGPNGRQSFYLDESGVVRGDDHQGGSPSASDPPVQ